MTLYHKILQSDLTLTRTTIGIASLLFSIFNIVDYSESHRSLDLFWFLFSFIHCMTVFYSITTDRINRCTLIGEAIAGFLLWNYISISLLVTQASFTTAFVPSGATLAPSFVIGATTWWILSRYPKTIKKAS